MAKREKMRAKIKNDWSIAFAIVCLVVCIVIAGMGLISFASAENDTNVSVNNTNISASNHVNISELRGNISEKKEELKNLTQNLIAMKKNWTEQRDEIRQQIKENRTEFVGCVSNSTKAKNDCLNETKQKEAACKLNAINVSNKSIMAQCLNESKTERQECMTEFSNVRNECKQLKHNWMEAIRAWFK